MSYKCKGSKSIFPVIKVKLFCLFLFYLPSQKIFLQPWSKAAQKKHSYTSQLCCNLCHSSVFFYSTYLLRRSFFNPGPKRHKKTSLIQVNFAVIFVTLLSFSFLPTFSEDLSSTLVQSGIKKQSYTSQLCCYLCHSSVFFFSTYLPRRSFFNPGPKRHKKKQSSTSQLCCNLCHSSLFFFSTYLLRRSFFNPGPKRHKKTSLIQVNFAVIFVMA